ncbi:hypothetical protein CBR_g16882 [Chara braunii]|uniref:Fe2OG dioxygenase domain-containing protein n=1 Tax=Chara braunii TaxID=69332 RepID=A0A388KU26_CHABU|nr:hypothetical protein CBR_g16882 [Chara braunii]|eukprot:GBG73539.1 hypothetical protein CBR_g16882 [Chara braunii]
MESHFDCEFELFVEFTGLISWSRGANLGWHHDSNRPYLKQRDFSAVCYLSDYGKDFTGGLFHFRDGEPETIVPKAGRLAIYTADEMNVHGVDRVDSGERSTITIWFSKDKSFDEDAAVLPRLVSYCAAQAAANVTLGRTDEHGRNSCIERSEGVRHRGEELTRALFPRPGKQEHIGGGGGGGGDVVELTKNVVLQMHGGKDGESVADEYDMLLSADVPLPFELSSKLYWVQDDYGFEPMIERLSVQSNPIDVDQQLTDIHGGYQGDREESREDRGGGNAESRDAVHAGKGQGVTRGVVDSVDERLSGVSRGDSPTSESRYGGRGAMRLREQGIGREDEGDVGGENGGGLGRENEQGFARESEQPGFDLRWWKLQQMHMYLAPSNLERDGGHGREVVANTKERSGSAPTDMSGFRLMWTGQKTICFRFVSPLHALQIACFCEFHFKSELGALCSCVIVDQTNITETAQDMRQSLRPIVERTPPAGQRQPHSFHVQWERNDFSGGSKNGSAAEEPGNEKKSVDGGGEQRQKPLPCWNHRDLCPGMRMVVAEWTRYAFDNSRKLQKSVEQRIEKGTRARVFFAAICAVGVEGEEMKWSLLCLVLLLASAMAALAGDVADGERREGNIRTVTDYSTKTSWPEVVGMTGDDAKRKIKDERPDLLTFVVHHKSSMILDYRLDRVRILVDGSSKVVTTPSIG